MFTVNLAYSVVRKCTAIRKAARLIQGKDGDGYGTAPTLRCKKCFTDRKKKTKNVKRFYIFGTYRSCPCSQRFNVSYSQSRYSNSHIHTLL